MTCKFCHGQMILPVSMFDIQMLMIVPALFQQLSGILRNSLQNIKFLFSYGVAPYHIAWLHNELLAEGAHSLTRNIDGKIFNTWQALYLNTVSTYKELIPNNEGS